MIGNGQLPTQSRFFFLSWNDSWVNQLRTDATEEVELVAVSVCSSADLLDFTIDTFDDAVWQGERKLPNTSAKFLLNVDIAVSMSFLSGE